MIGLIRHAAVDLTARGALGRHGEGKLVALEAGAVGVFGAAVVAAASGLLTALVLRFLVWVVEVEIIRNVVALETY